MRKCLVCNQDFDSSSFFYQQQICHRCFDKLKISIKDTKLGGYLLTTIYIYDNAIKQLIFDVKIKGDLELAKTILSPFVLLLKFKFMNYRIVVAPSTVESNQVRGYNHIQAIFTQNKFKVQEIFKKTSDWKQSSKPYHERRKISRHIELMKQPRRRKKYLIVDDIVTSGSTLLTCAELLKQKGIKNIRLLAIADNRRKG